MKIREMDINVSVCMQAFDVLRKNDLFPFSFLDSFFCLPSPS